MEDNAFYNTRAIMQIQEQAQELAKQANETMKKIEDRELIDKVIYIHEQSEYVKEEYEIMYEEVKSIFNGKKTGVEVCYRDKRSKEIVIIRAYVDLTYGARVEDYSHMYVGRELIKAMYKAIEGEGKA